MKKIGLKIVRVSGGKSTLLTLNEGEWARNAVDIRDILKLYDLTDDKLATLMSFAESGTFVTMALPIPGRGTDNTAAWIYIPNSIEVSGTEVANLMQEVKAELKKTRRDDARLEALFAKEYPATLATDFTPSSTDMNFAKRRVSNFDMPEVLGAKRYQPYYSDFKYILIEDDDSLKITDPRVVDISRKPLEETCAVYPPQGLPADVTVRFDDENKGVFTQPVFKKKGEMLKVVFERQGFLPIEHIDQVTENNQICSLPNNMVWKISVTKDFFKVVAHNSGDDLGAQAEIHINGKQLANRPIVLTEKEAKNATVKIKAPYFEEVETKVDFTREKVKHIRLHRAERTQNWEIILPDGSTAQMTLTSKALPLSQTESPLTGYKVDHARRLTYTAPGGFKQWAIGFMCAVALGLAIWIVCAALGWEDGNNVSYPPTNQTVTSNDDNKTTPPPVTSHTSAKNDDEGKTSDIPTDVNTTNSGGVEYLDNSGGKWTREDMEAYPELSGLFDELNTYDFQQILAREPLLRNSDQYQQLVSAIQANRSKTFNGRYCPDGDNTITLKYYIDKLNKPQNQAAATSQSGHSPASTWTEPTNATSTPAKAHPNGNTGRPTTGNSRGGV